MYVIQRKHTGLLFLLLVKVLPLYSLYYITPTSLRVLCCVFFRYVPIYFLSWSAS